MQIITVNDEMKRVADRKKPNRDIWINFNPTKKLIREDRYRYILNENKENIPNKGLEEPVELKADTMDVISNWLGLLAVENKLPPNLDGNKDCIVFGKKYKLKDIVLNLN
jgi:hypothetical protein